MCRARCVRSGSAERAVRLGLAERRLHHLGRYARGSWRVWLAREDAAPRCAFGWMLFWRAAARWSCRPWRFLCRNRPRRPTPLTSLKNVFTRFAPNVSPARFERCFCGAERRAARTPRTRAWRSSPGRRCRVESAFCRPRPTPARGGDGRRRGRRAARGHRAGLRPLVHKIVERTLAQLAALEVTLRDAYAAMCSEPN